MGGDVDHEAMAREEIEKIKQKQAERAARASLLEAASAPVTASQTAEHTQEPCVSKRASAHADEIKATRERLDTKMVEIEQKAAATKIQAIARGSKARASTLIDRAIEKANESAIDKAIESESIEKGNKADAGANDGPATDASTGVSRKSILPNGTVECTAAEGVPTIGLVFSSTAPDDVVIKRVNPGTWAEEQGIKAGDQLEAINGVKVSDMATDTFKQTMQKRPLVLQVCHVAAEIRADPSTQAMLKRATVFATEATSPSK